MATMTKSSVLVLVTLVGAGIAGSAAVLKSEYAGDAPPGPGGMQTTISSEAAVAWQGLRRRRPADPAPQEPPQVQVVVGADSFRTSVSVPTTAPSLDTVSLARALQRELKRAGCYHGEINGIWTPSTRQAMKAYTDIANARLPVTNPDPVLLALIQGDRNLDCTARCLRNGKPGTCREDGVAASSPANGKSAAASEESTAVFLEQPMALAGPKTLPSDEKASQAPVQKAKKRHNIDGSARAEHWSVKLWRDSAN
jgi:peptidoglycan hydrolase-like protein with peptidoglycan-binding domain